MQVIMHANSPHGKEYVWIQATILTDFKEMPFKKMLERMQLCHKDEKSPCQSVVLPVLC